jgi:uncharacterized lipoprotein YajG
MKLIIFAAALAALSACQPALQSLVGTQAPEQANLSRAERGGPVMRVQIPSRNANAELVRVARTNGVETWLAVDNISLSFREGVLVGSRGLGFDLMAGDAANTLTAISGQGVPVYRRQMRYLTGDHQSTYLMAGCSMDNAGVEIVSGQRLLRMEEKCTARRDVFTNIFWLNASGRIVETRQWVSPEIGYFRSSLTNARAGAVEFTLD